MRQRGRKSADALTVPGTVALMQRPEAPLDLTPEEVEVWQTTVEALPADWFPGETRPLLAQWCRHTVTARRVSQLIDAEMSRKEVDTNAIKDLLAMQCKETASLKALGASMRISQQSSYGALNSNTAKKNRAVTRPWE